MTDGPIVKPDVLVLAGGGILGEAWMSALLAGLEQATGVDFRRTETFVGTSAGSIVAAWLAAGRPPRLPHGTRRKDGNGTAGAYARSAEGAPPGLNERAPGEEGAIPERISSLQTLGRAAATAAAPLAPAVLSWGAPGGALLRSLALARAPEGERSLDDLRRSVEESGVRFDGRLRVVAVDRANGRRVVFGAPGAPPATVGEAVVASCAIPTVFRPERIGRREYVDGGVWSPTNIDVAPVSRGARVLCLNPTGALPVSLDSMFGAYRGIARAAEATEALALRGRGANVRVIAPDARAAEAMGTNLMNPGPRRAVADAAFRQGLELGS